MTGELSDAILAEIPEAEIETVEGEDGGELGMPVAISTFLRCLRG